MLANGKSTFLIGLILCGVLLAPSPISAVELSTSTLDGGGQRVASSLYVIDGHIGGIAGVSDANTPAYVMRHGYVGQLTEIAELNLSALPDPVDEESDAQLIGRAVNDDHTITVVGSTDIQWSPAAWPLASISPAGIATTEAVYEDTLAFFEGWYLGQQGTGTLLVLDIDPDNFGLYANDGMPDDWQVLHFGIDNPDAFPDADPTETGQNTFFRYVAGLNPTNAADLFILRIAPVQDESDQVNVIYEPVRPGRLYTVRYATNLTAGSWSNLASAGVPITNVQEVTVTDLEAMPHLKNYKIRIRLQ